MQCTKRTDPHGPPPRLICSGRYVDILLLDPFSFEILYTLSSRMQSDWMAAVCEVQLPSSAPHFPQYRDQDILIGLTKAGVVKVWTIGHNEPKVA